MKIISAIFVLWASLLAAAAETFTITFDDLPQGAVLSGTTYGNVFWEYGNAGYQGNPGFWMVPSMLAHPSSSPNNVVNAWGSTLTGMRFPTPVKVVSADFSAQGTQDSWSPSIRVHGFLNDVEVGTTDWFGQIGSTPALFDIVSRMWTASWSSP